MLLPRAKNINMLVLRWFLFVMFNGCIGLLSMLARYHYFADRTPNDTALSIN